MNPVKFRNNRAWILQSVHFYQESNKKEQQAAVKGCEITGGLPYHSFFFQNFGHI